jgi:hypothetical protein
VLSASTGNNGGGLFKCYDAVDLMSVIPGPACRENPFGATVEFLSCVEDNDDADKLSNDMIISNDDSGGRGLRKGGKSGKRGGGKDDDNNNSEDEDERSFETSSKSSIVTANVTVLENFESNTCSMGCILTGHHICFDANLKIYESERDYRLSYRASHGDETSFHTVTVAIQRDANIMENCDTAQTTCIDRTGL